MDYLARISEVLYVGLCRNECIGTPTEVTIRREVGDMWETIVRPIYKHVIYIFTGSFKEGFRFKSSDIDAMQWLTDCDVIDELSHYVTSQTSGVDVILLEHSETPPGFVMLKLLSTVFVHEHIFSLSTVTYKNSRYISSDKFRNTFLTIWNLGGENARSHGPCINYYYENKECDFAMCFACLYWPQTALSWFDRCQNQGWPVQGVLKEILSNGYHVMPIGSERYSNDNELEWRISFSLAEQKMVYSMNHTQFLCYGVLKIFLEEVLSSTNGDSLLCSYFMKTILFWEIQNNPDNLFWCPKNLLTCLSMCFKRLCKCVFDSYCPNFFIPENNMFKHKVIGASREVLLSQLYRYYEMREFCMLQSPTLSSIILPG